MQQLNIYISYSLNNTSQSTLNEIESALRNRGYNVSRYIKGDTYTTEKINAADIVLFIGKPIAKSTTKFGTSEYLSKGQHSEFILTRSRKRPFFFFGSVNSEYDELDIRYYHDGGDTVLGNWKTDYSQINLYASLKDINIAISELFNLPGKQQDNNLLLLL